MIERQTEQIPWTLQQTYIGILFTLVPWLTFSLLLSFGGSSTPARPITPQQDLARAIITFVFATLIEATFLLAPFYFARRAYRHIEDHRRQGWQGVLQVLGFRRCSWWNAVLLVLAFFGFIWLINLGYGYLIGLIHQLFPSIIIQTNNVRVCEQSKIAPLSTDATLIVAFLVAPICEEVFFRSFVFMGLLRGMSLVWAVIFSSLIFAIAHTDAASFPVLFIIGLLLAFLRWYTRSLWPSIALHILNNGSSALLIFLATRGMGGIC